MTSVFFSIFKFCNFYLPLCADTPLIIGHTNYHQLWVAICKENQSKWVFFASRGHYWFVKNNCIFWSKFAYERCAHFATKRANYLRQKNVNELGINHRNVAAYTNSLNCPIWFHSWQKETKIVFIILPKW